MCCLLVILSLFGPRFAFFVTWLTTERVTAAFHSGFVVPLLGLIFMPWTALVYTYAFAPVTGVSTLGWFFVSLGLLADLGSYAAGPSQRARVRPSAV